jgi:hypothetical protein
MDCTCCSGTECRKNPFKVLFEIGALTQDMSVKLSRVLLGEDEGAKRQRKPNNSRAGDGAAKEAWGNKDGHADTGGLR